MSRELLEENDFAESPLGIGGVLEGVEILFEGHDFLCALIDGFPDNAVGAFS